MLVIDISVNREVMVSSIGAQRISHTESRPGDDDLCRYKVGRVFEGKIRRPVGEVLHRYGDGAEVLAKLAIEKVVRDSDMSALEESNFEILAKFYADNI